MKKLLLMLIMLSAATASVASQVRVVTTYPYIADIVHHIGGEHVSVTALARGDYNPHTIIPKPSFISRLRQADLLIINGAQLEIGWLPPLMRQANNPLIMPGRPGFLDLSGRVKLIDVPKSVSREQGDVHPDGNPHFYLDPHNIPPIARAISGKLSEMDTLNASNYERNLSGFLARWSAKTREWDGRLSRQKGVSVIEYHKNYDYLLRRYGIQLAGTVEPLPGIPPTSRHIGDLEKVISSRRISCILQDVYNPADASEHLSRKHGIRMIVLPHDVGAVGSTEGIIPLFDEIVRRLAQ